MPKIRNIIIFVIIAAAFVSIYIFFIKPSPDEGTGLLVSPSAGSLPAMDGTTGGGVVSGSPFVAQDFLALLLNVKNITLDDSIFFDPAFNSLQDSSITLIQDGTEGRPNPFAPFGSSGTSVSPVTNPNPTSTPASSGSSTSPIQTSPVTPSGTNSGSNAPAVN